ncbi:MAG: type I-C CRISPR-associated protein Cas8c/Csd1 [Planctomycetota bacterium]|jgi:CRISPR-associated protein Csd1|nr:type I-C CRISPR-associated protein Cas8c/Csd1 [Planctomycetota bacterium]
MILQRLCEYYDRLAADLDSSIAPHGMVMQNIAFAVILEPNGRLHQIEDMRLLDGKSLRPRRMLVPDCGSRTSGISAQFLWDKAEYLLGSAPAELRSPLADEKTEATRQKKLRRIADSHGATVDVHARVPAGLNPAVDTLNTFFTTWSATQLTEDQCALLEELSGGFGVFRIRGEQEFVHEDKNLQRWWSNQSQSETGAEGQARCLITGETATIARLHPLIKGVAGAQTSGAGIATFNLTAFESYGHKQGDNAPVGEESVFRYTTALNHLLQRDNRRRIQVGDATVVFWAQRPTAIADCDAEELLLLGLGGDSEGAEDTGLATRVGEALGKLREGTIGDIEADVPFFLLGLAPNNSRLSIRIWEECTLGQLLNRVGQHQRELNIARSNRDREHLPLWLLLRQTARESKEIPPLFGGALLRAVLTGGRYPDAILAAALRRIRAGDDFRHPRAALIKAILIRNHAKEIPVMLDENRPEPAYQLGRLFAVLEKAQEDALPGINATVKDRYFGAASATPATVFPRLIRGSQHHIHKLDGGMKVNTEKRVQAVMERIDGFPSHLDLVGQGLFAIGYYHQRQSFFTKKAPASADID